MDEEVETCHFDFKEPCFNLLVHKIDLDASVTVNKTGSNWPRAVDAGVVPRANSTESVQYFWGHLCRCVRTMRWETDVKCLSLLLLKAVLSFELLRPSQPRQSAGLEFSRQNTWPSLFLQGNVITQSPLVSLVISSGSLFVSAPAPASADDWSQPPWGVIWFYPLRFFTTESFILCFGFLAFRTVLSI